MSPRSVSYSAVFLGGLSTFAFMVYAADEFNLLVVAFTICVLSPYATFAIATHIAHTRGSIMAVLVASLISTCVAAFLYIDTLFFHVSSTGALVFVSIPFCQLLGAFVVLAFALARRRHATQDI